MIAGPYVCTEFNGVIAYIDRCPIVHPTRVYLSMILGPRRRRQDLVARLSISLRPRGEVDTVSGKRSGWTMTFEHAPAYWEGRRILGPSKFYSPLQDTHDPVSARQSRNRAKTSRSDRATESQLNGYSNATLTWYCQGACTDIGLLIEH